MPDDIEEVDIDTMPEFTETIDEPIVDEFTEEELKAFEEADKQAERDDLKKKELANLTVKQHNVEFDADETAQNNMTSVLSIANWQFNKNSSTMLYQLASNPALSPEAKALIEVLAQGFDGLYKQIYKQKIFWKGADNKAHEVEAETVGEALYKTMSTKSSIIEDTVINKKKGKKK